MPTNYCTDSVFWRAPTWNMDRKKKTITEERYIVKEFDNLKIKYTQKSSDTNCTFSLAYNFI